MLLGLSLWQLALALTCALLLDKWLGEPSRWHPLIGFGNWAIRVEKWCRALSCPTNWQGRLAWLMAVMPVVIVVGGLFLSLANLGLWPWLLLLLHAVIIYLCLGGKSLEQHALAIYAPLSQGDMNQARHAVQMIVSRDAQQMDDEQIAIAAVESVLENGNDAVIGTLFWGLLFGAPGAVIFRLVNTLDAMWGYKNPRYLSFGRFAAKTDDKLGFIPARITAFGYAILGDTKRAIDCVQTQAQYCSSPNGGVAMCAGAGALNVRLGGRVCYHGEWIDKPNMGSEQKITPQDIPRACRLLDRSVWLALVIIWAIALLV